MKILLIRLRSIGDIVQCTPAFAAARKLFAGSSIDLLVDQKNAELVTENPAFDSLVLYDGGRRGFFEKLRYDFEFAMTLRSRRYDVVVDFHGIPKTAWFAFFSGARVRAGYDYPGRGRLYTHTLRPPARFTVHSARNQIDLLGVIPEEFLSRRFSPDDFGLDTFVSADFAAAECDGFLRDRNIEAGTKIFVYHISPSNDFKRWPGEKYSALINMIERHPAFSAGRIAHVVAGTASDREEYSAIASRIVTVRGSIHSACAELTLGGLFNLCRRADCYVGPDSGPLHVAAASGCPVVGIFGPTNVETFAPPSPLFAGVFDETLKCRPCDQKKCVSGDFRCIRAIKPQKVMDALLGAVIKRNK